MYIPYTHALSNLSDFALLPSHVACDDGPRPTTRWTMPTTHAQGVPPPTPHHAGRRQKVTRQPPAWYCPGTWTTLTSALASRPRTRLCCRCPPFSSATALTAVGGCPGDSIHGLAISPTDALDDIVRRARVSSHHHTSLTLALHAADFPCMSQDARTRSTVSSRNDMGPGCRAVWGLAPSNARQRRTIKSPDRPLLRACRRRSSTAAIK